MEKYRIGYSNLDRWKDVRVVEGVDLERLYDAKHHRGFESLSFRTSLKDICLPLTFYFLNLNWPLW